MRKSLAALATATLLALSSGCGGPGGDDANPASASATAESSPAAVAATTSTGLTRENFVERLGAAQAAAGSVHLEVASEGRGGGLASSGDIALGGTIEDARTRVTLDLGPLKGEFRLADGVAYIKLGAMTGGKYAKVDLTDPNDPMVKRFGAMTHQLDPRAQLKTFDSALLEFEDLGDGGRIDGVETTKIKLVLDTAQLTKQGTDKGRDSAEYVLHVGPDDLLRRVTTDVAGTPTTMTWSKWGEPVDVAVPPASQITDSSTLVDLAGLLGARGAGA